MQTTQPDVVQETTVTTSAQQKLPYRSPELRVYGDVYERTNTSLPFTFNDNFVLHQAT